MPFPNTKVELDPRPDQYGNIFHVGRNASPFLLRFKKGVIFFVFISEFGNEELHIGCAKSGSQCDSIKKRMSSDGPVDRYVIRLERREDENSKTYFTGIVQDDSLELDMESGFVFFVFTSKPGKEELHITKNRENHREVERTDNFRYEPEIIRRNDQPRRPDSGEFKITSRHHGHSNTG